MKTFECMDCNGEGEINARAGDGDIETWGCPECSGSGQVDLKNHREQEECCGLLREIMAAERL